MSRTIGKQAIGILGMGAIGSVVAAKLLGAGYHPGLIARSNYEAIRMGGFKVVEASSGTEQAFSSDMLNLYHPRDPSLPIFDILLLCTQTTQNTENLALISRVIKKKGIIITLQNGFNFEETLEHAFPDVTIISGTAWVKSSGLSPTETRHDFGLDLVLGQYSSKSKEVELNLEGQEACNILSEVGFNLMQVRNVKSAQWTKLILNLPFFTVCPFYGKSVAEVLHDEMLYAEMIALHHEMLDVAERLEQHPDKEYLPIF